ncbi:unnamed protein product [Pleuronectes platessa]|uniref:Uncharacterized protein n=1 Tax=Pleuronectes platessa TaxID=8262 RepID=A0A9N7TLY8_PLEPL|nr:unnamed protein product [Pleuronectes platessa]
MLFKPEMDPPELNVFDETRWRQAGHFCVGCRTLQRKRVQRIPPAALVRVGSPLGVDVMGKQSCDPTTGTGGKFSFSRHQDKKTFSVEAVKCDSTRQSKKTAAGQIHLYNGPIQDRTEWT